MREELLMANIIVQKMNVDDLLAQLKERGVSMSRSAFYNKKNGRSEFTRAEIQAIASVLQLTNDKVLDIFFN